MKNAINFYFFQNSIPRLNNFSKKKILSPNQLLTLIPMASKPAAPKSPSNTFQTPENLLPNHGY